MATAETDGAQARAGRFPFALRVLGALAIVSAVGNVATYAATLAFLGVLTLDGTMFEQLSTVTTVLIIVYVILLLASAVGQIVLGVRLLRSKHRGAAVAAKALAGVEALRIVCNIMVHGLSANVIGSVIAIVLLAVLEIYADPTLAAERLVAHIDKELEDKADQEAGTLGLDKTGRGYIRLDFFNIFWVFVVCCTLGLVLEVIWHMVVVDPGVYEDRAGLLYGPFSPIYGFGAVLMTIALNRFHKSNPIVIFLVAGLIGAAFEYLVSWWMEFSFGIKAWDYTGTFLNIGGRTNFFFFCMWGALGLVWLRWILPWLLALVNRIPWNWRYGLTAVSFVLMLADCALTVASFDCWYQRQAGVMDQKEQSAIDVFCNEHYPDSFMEARFQSMTMDVDSATRL